MLLVYENKQQVVSAEWKDPVHMSPHLHEAIEIVYITDGCIELGVGQELYHMEKGDFAIVFPNVIHHYQVLKPGNINVDIKTKTVRIENLNKCFAYADIIKDNKPIYDEWRGKTLFKDSLYNSHKEQIDKYKRARAMLEKITGSSAIKIKDWKKEIQSLESEISKLNRQSQSIKEEYESINHIKYAVKTVNEDYGIDLSIEIDKAIKRGEKPSVIAQIKKYQEQQEAYEKRKKNTKNYYRNEER